MNLAARREPTFHSGTQDSAHDAPFSATRPYLASGPSGFTRFVSTLQIAGTVLGVPLGLASGYSIYRANFSVETTCQNLRGSIISMLDKGVDAATRRMLVRRDVAAFEQSCGGVDPDAHAAFKVLLTAGTPAVAAAPKARIAAPPVEVARKPEPKPEPKSEVKSEPRPSIANKQPVTVAAHAAAEPVQRDAELSDARWLAAVRQALVTHGPERKPSAEAATAKPLRTETPAASKSAAPVLQPAWIVPPAATPPAELPVAVHAPQLNDDRPVPPASIPEPVPAAGDANDDARGRSRLSAWISEIPFVGRVIEPRGY